MALGWFEVLTLHTLPHLHYGEVVLHSTSAFIKKSYSNHQSACVVLHRLGHPSWLNGYAHAKKLKICTEYVT